MKSFTIKSISKLSLNELLRTELPSLLGEDVSNSKIRRLIVAGGVSVNGRQIRVPSYTVFSKSTVNVQIEEKKLFYEKQPDDIKFELTQKDVLYEDESIIVVNKPFHFPTEAGMVESRDNLHAAVVRFLFERQKIEKPNAKNPPYAGIMHRLDRDTSGVILFTKSRSVNAACHDMFENHTARKIYNAVVCVKSSELKNYPSGKEFSVNIPLGRISPKGQAAKWGRVSEKNGGLPSKTEFTVLEEIQLQIPDFAQNYAEQYAFLLVECRPLTGRTHQIRVHLSLQNLPILGDTLYGALPYERILLHARSLTFPHPVTAKKICVESDFVFPRR
ncbi:RluA family pseudouridine synthase [Treponema sp.]|uniref:RluA family pseudouridine synthase n=1 Tax=Treponema sp. TaxID=166 RepID=UPI00389104D1